MAETEEKTKKSKGFNKITFIVFFVFLALIAIAGWSFFQYYQAQQEIARLSTLEGQKKLAQEEVDALLKQVQEHMVLPDKEKPTVATVTDAGALKKNQPFFAKAENGDKVIVYVQEGKAIIYSPKKDLIVNVGFVAVDGKTTSGEEGAEAVSVEVRNGTSRSGLAREVSEKLSNANVTVAKTSDSRKKDYTETVVVNLGTSDNTEAINQIASSLNAEVVTALPEGESTSTANVLVIAGSDQVQ